MRSSKTKLHMERANNAPKTVTQRVSWKFGALASAVALLGSLASVDAHALALGRVTVQSALGEALRAEIDIAEINAEEAGSLRVGIASAEAFKAAGLEYSPTVVGLQISLQKRKDGRSFLRLSSPRPVTEPFVDLVVEANWASGRVVRDYTMLFDPPNLRQSSSVGTAPSIGNAAPQGMSRPSAASASESTSGPSAPAIRPVPMARTPRPKVEAARKQAGDAQQVTVKAGDTAGKIASQNKPSGVSLDQMLVALLKSNPEAFVNGNINRLRSGAVLDLPGEEAAGATPAGQASQTIIAQSKDFNNFRRKLAEGAPAAQVAGADRKADGKLQAKVDDSASGAKPPDKLTLSKGAVQGKAAAEEKIAKDRQASAESTRVAELSKNIGELNKLKGTTTAAVPAGVASAAKTPGVAVPLPSPAIAAAPAVPAGPAAVVAAPPSAALKASAATTTVPAAPATAPPVAPAGVASASQPTAPLAAAATTATAVVSATPSLVVTASPTSVVTASATAPALTASGAASPVAVPAAGASAAAPAAPKKVVVVPPPAPQASFIDELLGNDFVLPVLAGLLALLGVGAFYRHKKKSSPAAVDSSFLESRLQPDSFFGASGGQRVDTSESSASGSSLVYSPSQLDAAGDVDPVAEADVYLAYGRDLQAEEILKEALRTTPARVAIHAKLVEIYSKRRDSKGLEAIAGEAFKLTSGTGPEWNYISELGRELEPGNSLYQPGGQPEPAPLSAAAKSAQLAKAFGSDTIPVPHAVSAAEAASVATDVDFDLDLDFSAGNGLSPATAVHASNPAAAQSPGYPTNSASAAKAEPAPLFDSGSMDFDDVKLATQPMGIKAGAVKPADASFSATQPLVAIKPSASSAAPAAVLDSGMLEFDMGSLSLDLDAPTNSSRAGLATASGAAFVPEGPLETKFALAEEFRALGDPDGARSLASEVVAQAQGALKTKAQAFLNSLM